MNEDIKRLVEALEPFARMAEVLETRALVTFGRTVLDSERLLVSAGEAGTASINMGDFRRALAAFTTKGMDHG